MAILPLGGSHEELRLTVSSAEMVLPSLDQNEEIFIACEISSLPTHNCNVVFRRSQTKQDLTGQMCFLANRPLVTADLVLDYSVFEKLKAVCFKGEPVRPITFYLKIGKSREIQNGEIIILKHNFTLNVFDLSWRLPLF
jgi:hypothetical protein|tara:strand:+ start:258 stop:674 length:417 start_codon:yes stop_codon:yes gene_type:complete